MNYYFIEILWNTVQEDFLCFQRVPKLQAEDQAVWWDTLNKMQKLLRKAAASLFANGQIDKDIQHNYFMSGKSHVKVYFG